MSWNQSTARSVLFTYGHGACYFPHPLLLPPSPLHLDVPPPGMATLLSLHAIKVPIHLVAHTTMAPIERIHLLIQNQNEMIKAGRLSTPYKGIKDCFLKTIKQDGIISLWRGNSVNVYKVVGFEALALAIGKNSWHNAAGNEGDKYAGLKFEAAVFSATLIQYPLDYARTRLANDVEAESRVQLSFDSARKNLNKDVPTRQFTRVFDVYNKTLASDGIIGLYRGYSLSFLGILAWDFTRERYEVQHEIQERSTLSENIKFNFMLYSIPVALYPLTCVSRRMMMNSGEATNKYKNSMHAFREIIKHEGFCSLYKGATAGITLCFGRLLAVSAATRLLFFLDKKFSDLNDQV